MISMLLDIKSVEIIGFDEADFTGEGRKLSPPVEYHIIDYVIGVPR